MGFEGPSQQPNKPESVEKTVYRIAELEQQLGNLETQQKEVLKTKPGVDPVLGVNKEKLKEVTFAIETTKGELLKEKDRVSPEDRELLETLDQEKEGLKLQATGFSNLLKRYRSMQDFKGNPHPDVNSDEYGQLTQELSQAQSDFRNRRSELAKRMEDLVSRGLINRSEITKLPNL